jgi:hypothetical protein|tara:strand:- start:11 stop:127 length:117 start_codon:yes stop_codon:yes gene_type:complete
MLKKLKQWFKEVYDEDEIDWDQDPRFKEFERRDDEERL